MNADVFTIIEVRSADLQLYISLIQASHFLIALIELPMIVMIIKRNILPIHEIYKIIHEKVIRKILIKWKSYKKKFNISDK